MNKKIAIAVMLISWLVIPSANALTAATGFGSGTGSGTTTYTTSGSGSGTGSTYTPPGDITMGYGSGSGTGSGCWYGCTVPEPGTYLLMGIGFLGIYLARRGK